MQAEIGAPNWPLPSAAPISAATCTGLEDSSSRRSTKVLRTGSVVWPVRMGAARGREIASPAEARRAFGTSMRSSSGARSEPEWRSELDMAI